MAGSDLLKAAEPSEQFIFPQSSVFTYYSYTVLLNWRGAIDIVCIAFGGFIVLFSDSSNTSGRKVVFFLHIRRTYGPTGLIRHFLLFLEQLIYLIRELKLFDLTYVADFSLYYQKLGYVVVLKVTGPWLNCMVFLLSIVQYLERLLGWPRGGLTNGRATMMDHQKIWRSGGQLFRVLRLKMCPDLFFSRLKSLYCK